MKRINYKKEFDKVIDQLSNPKLTQEEIDSLMLRLLYIMAHLSLYQIYKGDKSCENQND